MRQPTDYGLRTTDSRAFTLIELLVVIGIIALLASILFPVISKVRETAREADTRSLINSLETAAQAYKQDFNSYPGPLSGAYIAAADQTNFTPVPTGWRAGDTGIGVYDPATQTSNPNGFQDSQIDPTGTVATGQRVTEAENFVLGLLGGVNVNKKTANSYYLEYDASTVGQGPALLNPVRTGRTKAYMQSASLSTGRFVDDNGSDPDSTGFVRSKDSMIPEFVDRFSQPMPILVLRARVGGRSASQTVASAYADDNNDVVVNLPSSEPKFVNGQYNLCEITPYTQSMIGLPRNLKTSAYIPSYDPTKPHGLTGVDTTKGMNRSGASGEYVYPYDGFSYLADPASYTLTDPVGTKKAKMKARKADTLILISAGRDRVYGTDDDVANFGSVRP